MQRKLAIPLWILIAAIALVAAKALTPPDSGSSTGAQRARMSNEPPAGDRPWYPDTPGHTLEAAHSPLGTVIVDGYGYTLYRFDESSQPVASQRTDPRVDPLPERRLLSCDGGSPAGWPPVAYSRNTSLMGIDRKLLGFLARADGSLQVTIRGCPLYRFDGDRTPGQIHGHGVARVWFAATPTGNGTTASRWS